FNAHLHDTVFLGAHEAFFAGDRAHASILRSVITDPTLPVEPKFRNMFNARNMLHIMMTANPGWVVPNSLDERRFFLLPVGADRIGDFAYFDAIFTELEAGGYEALLYDLLAHDLSNFDVRAFPDTEEAQEQKKHSLPTHLSWWQEVLGPDTP